MMTWPRFVAWCLLGGGVLLARTGWSLGLGEIAVGSHLGEHFRARIPVLASRQELAGLQKCFRLGGTPDAGNDVPLLRRARLDYMESNGRPFLIISGFHPLNEPILRVVVTGCDGVGREYFVFLDPKSDGEPAPEQDEAPPPRVGAGKATRAEMPRVAPARAEKTLAAAPAPSPAPVPARNRRAPLARKPDFRLEISAAKVPLPAKNRRPAAEEAPGDEKLHLRLASELGTAGNTTLTAEQKESLRQRQRLLASPETQVDALLALQLRLKQNDEQIAALRKEMEALRKKAEDDARAARQAREAAESSRRMMWLTLAGIFLAVLLAGLGFGWRWWSKRRVNGVAERAEGHTGGRFPDTIPYRPAAAPEEADTIPVLDEEVRRPSSPRPAATQRAASAEPSRERRAAAPAHARHPDGIGVEIQGPIESAELLVAVGEADRAIELLEHTIRQQPDAPVDIWLKLLVIYRQTKRRAEFEALADRLHRRYNVKAPGWEKTPQETHVPQSLAEFPRLMEKITRMWGTPECLAFLHDLLKDSRDGERIGFSIGVVKEIRALIRQLEKGLGHENESTAGGISARDERVLMNDEPLGGTARELPREGAPLEEELATLGDLLAHGRDSATKTKTAPPDSSPAQEAALPRIDFVLPDAAPASASAETAAKPDGEEGIPNIPIPDGGMTWEAFAAVLDTHEREAAGAGEEEDEACVSALEERYPRVAEKIVRAWGRPGIEQVMRELLLDDRGNRQGFDQDTMSDLMLLGTLVTMYAQRDDAWGGQAVSGGRR